MDGEGDEEPLGDYGDEEGDDAASNALSGD